MVLVILYFWSGPFQWPFCWKTLTRSRWRQSKPTTSVAPSRPTTSFGPSRTTKTQGLGAGEAQGLDDFSDVHIVNGSNMDRPCHCEIWSCRSLYMFEIIHPSMDKFEEDFTTRIYCRIPLELTIQIHDFPLNLLNLEPMPNPNSKRKHIHY